MKYRNVRKMFLDLQRFAGGETEETSGESGTEDEVGGETEGADEDPEEKKFSQKDMEEEVEKRLARERRKWKRQQQKTGSRGKAGEEKGGPEESEDAMARKAAEEKADSLEVKVACYEAGVAKDAVEDVAALARSYMAVDETLDLEDAIEKVVGKYPQFKAQKAGEEEADGAEQNKSWGERHRRAAKSAKTVDDEIKEQLFGK